VLLALAVLYPVSLSLAGAHTATSATSAASTPAAHRSTPAPVHSPAAPPPAPSSPPRPPPPPPVQVRAVRRWRTTMPSSSSTLAHRPLRIRRASGTAVVDAVELRSRWEGARGSTATHSA